MAAEAAPSKEVGPREAKNVVHEMSMWKQLIDNELRTAAEWEANWGFLRLGQEKSKGFNTPRDEAGSQPGSQLNSARGAPGATPRGVPIATPRAGAGHAAMGATPRGSRLATPRGGGVVAAAGAAALQTPRMAIASPAAAVAAEALVGSYNPEDLGASMHGPPTADAFMDMDPVMAEACRRDHRFAVLMRARKTPKERFGRQVLSSHKVGWGNSLERFGVNHYGKRANDELWPAL